MIPRERATPVGVEVRVITVGTMSVLHDRLQSAGLIDQYHHIRDWDACMADPVVAALLATLPGDPVVWVELLMEAGPVYADQVLETPSLREAFL